MSDQPVSKAPSQIAAMFDAIAGKYDFLNHLLSAGTDRRWRRRAIEALALTGKERVLDVCTGTADLAIAAVSGPHRAARVVGVDFAQEMLRIGVAKLRQHRLSNTVTLVRGDATRLPFLWVLLGILGGVEAFQLLGLFLGPAVMAALMMLWRELAGENGGDGG